MAIVLFAAIPLRAWAWGNEGHEIVGRIATARLTDKAAAEVRALIGSANLGDDDICNWADAIKLERGETKPWHYVDIPVDKDNHPTKFDPARDCKDEQCVIGQINHFVSVLKDPKAARSDRIDALKFVVHFVGDIHQPLHCADRPYGSQPHDRGGNSVHVIIAGSKQPWNLHSIWDFYLVQSLLGQTSVADYSAALTSKITAAQSAEWLASKDPVSWANESNEIAAKVVYNNIPSQPASPRPIALDEAYFATAKPVVEQQLTKAGVRLAQVLNDALAEH
ncbi:MAG TPA: S1/P1 nuclease [Tepidisphaeraceae bacterium]|nr:S1/P1 nuclease [Tepidisphaeraceae bacterium]